MAFVLTLMYTALTLLSPAVLPQEVMQLHVADILGGLAVIATLVALPGSAISSIPETYLALGLVITTGLSTLATGWVGGVPATILGFLPIAFNFYFIIVSCCTVQRIRLLVIILFAIAFYILLQGVLADHANNISSPYLDPETVGDTTIYRYRGLGVLNDPNDLAQFLVMLLPLSWLWWRKGDVIRNLAFTILPAIALLIGIYSTHSRGGIVAIIAVLLFGSKNKLGVVKSILFTGVATLGILASNISGGRGMNDDDGGRVAAWVTGLELFKRHPIFGVGVNNFGEYNPTGLTAHNSYVLCLAELGLVGYVFWMGMIVSGWVGLSQVLSTARISFAENTICEVALPASDFPPRVGTKHYAAQIQEMDSKTLHDAREEFAHLAAVMRVSLVALLTASFFLSRTYSMTLYVLWEYRLHSGVLVLSQLNRR